jgi:predicted ATPase
MQTKVIEVTVTGETGTGKSEVLEVIANALNAFYGRGSSRIKVAGKVCPGAIDEAKHTNQTAKDRDTVFVLREENIAWRPRGGSE